MNKNLYIGIEDVAVCAFELLNQNDDKKIVNVIPLALLEEYGRILCEMWKKKNPKSEAIALFSKANTAIFLKYNSEYFECIENNESEYGACLKLKYADFKSLTDKAISYRSPEFIQTVYESQEILKDMCEYLEENKDVEILDISIENLIYILFTEINTIGRSEVIYNLPIEFVEKCCRKFLAKFNAKYIPQNKKVIYDIHNAIASIPHIETLPDESIKLYRDNENIIISDKIALEDIVDIYRNKVSTTFIREIKSDSLNINDMYDEYVFDKTAIKKEKKLEV